MIFTAAHADGPLTGTVRVPGDKSISHRAVLFAAMSKGTSALSGVLDSEDVRSTVAAVRALGADVRVVSERPQGLDLVITGWGERGPSEPDAPIDCGNSGTTCRLLMGVISGWPITAVLDGDASLRRRPMNRVIEPLARMGATFDSTGGLLPVTVRGADLHAIDYSSPVASAQVKTAVLLAGLRAHGTTTVREPSLSRDHTSRLLPAFGVHVQPQADPLVTAVRGPVSLVGAEVSVPGDPSSAAFPAGAAALVPGSDVSVLGLAANPTRLGFVRVLQRMGADVSLDLGPAAGEEPVGDLRVRYNPALSATTVACSEVASLIDEIPLLAVVATSARGTTRFEGVAELRVKETDRLAAIVEGLTALGATGRGGDDWLEVDGPVSLHGATLSSAHDHRLAMAWAVAGLVATSPVSIDAWEAIAVSYPRFGQDLDSLRM